MNGFLPIHRKGNYKQFQLNNNQQNWKYGLIINLKEFCPVFVSEYFEQNALSITSFTAKRLDPTKLGTARNIADIDNAVIETTSLLTTYIKTQTQEGYSRYYSEGDYLATQLVDGLYFLYFTDGANVFESDIFCITSDVLGDVLSLRWDTEYFTFDTETITFDNET